MKQPFAPVSSLNLFPTFQTREEYEAKTGQPCPEWNPSRRPKSWFDPDSTEVFVGPDGTGFALYDRVLSGKPDKDGVPGLTRLAISVAEARTVNIPPKGPGATNVPGADQPEVPVPLKALGPTQVLVYRFGSTVAVRNMDVALDTSGDGFTQADRDLLKAIAARLLA